MSIVVGNELVPVVPTEAALEQAADPAQYVALACERAKAWLADALEHGEIEQIVELKSQAEAMRIYTQQKQLGKDAELSAAEIVRRAQRGIAVAIRRGQVEGTIRTVGEHAGTPVAGDPCNTPKASAKDYVADANELTDSYAMADGVHDEVFDNAIAEARAETNLSRANVVRKLGKEPARPPARPEVLRGTRHHDPNRVVQATVDGAVALTAGQDLFNFQAVDPARIPGWVSSLEESIRFLTTLKKNLNKELTRG